MVDLVGEKYGRLTVVGFDRIQNHKTYWHCRRCLFWCSWYVFGSSCRRSYYAHYQRIDDNPDRESDEQEKMKKDLKKVANESFAVKSEVMKKYLSPVVCSDWFARRRSWNEGCKEDF